MVWRPIRADFLANRRFNFTYLIEATAVAKNAPAGPQFSAFVYGFGMLLDV